MTTRKLFCVLGMAAACMPMLSGCGGKESETGGTATTTSNGGQAMLNNPNIPEADKEKIRKSMGGSPGAAAGGAGTAGTSGTTSGQ